MTSEQAAAKIAELAEELLEAQHPHASVILFTLAGCVANGQEGEGGLALLSDTAESVSRIMLKSGNAKYQ